MITGFLSWVSSLEIYVLNTKRWKWCGFYLEFETNQQDPQNTRLHVQVIKLSTKSMNDESKNVTRHSPIFCCWGQSYWSLLRWKFLFHCVCISAPNRWVVRRSLLNAAATWEFSWRWNIFQEQEVNGRPNVAAMRSNFLLLTNRVGVFIIMSTIDVRDDEVHSSTVAVCSSFI